uniref:C2 PI3K-type domain-containing protein n=1 Tax=Kalanchoe fedtschenkoi TaxID=63787 RepID=A0A7N0T5Q7_KALFE
MSGNEYKVERFFLSCDINLRVTFRIERLEGKLPSVKRPISEAGDLEERKPELYVECRLYIDGAPFGLPYKTRLVSSGPSYSWSELITLSTKYRDLTAHSQLAFTEVKLIFTVLLSEASHYKGLQKGICNFDCKRHEHSRFVFPQRS